jgi:hypothetical protein
VIKPMTVFSSSGAKNLLIENKSMKMIDIVTIKVVNI